LSKTTTLAGVPETLPAPPRPAATPPAAGARAEEIYRVAVALFLERGYDNTPLSLIARELGLTKAGLYHHFESKEHLLFLAHRDSIEKNLVPIIERAEQEPDPEVRLDRYLREFAKLMGSDPAIRLLIDEAKRLSPGNFEVIQAVWRRGYGVMRRSIDELQAARRCDPGLNPAFAAFAAIGMCTWTLYWFDPDRDEKRDELGETFARVFLHGLLDGEAKSREPRPAGPCATATRPGSPVAGERTTPGGER
jgi:AcrR family transcriptional regulator